MLALAVLLAPLEFALAHDISNLASEPMMAHQHVEADMNYHGIDMDAAETECDGETACKDCVYCSPALNVSSRFQLDQLPCVQPVATASLRYSIDLPVDIRPPISL